MGSQDHGQPAVAATVTAQAVSEQAIGPRLTAKWMVLTLAASLLLMFGANWCPDCRVLAAAMDSAELSDLLQRHFVQMKVDVGDRLDAQELWSAF